MDICDFLDEKNMAEVMQCDLRLDEKRPFHFCQFLLGLAVGAFSHHVRSPATLRPPFGETVGRDERKREREQGRERDLRSLSC